MRSNVSVAIFTLGFTLAALTALAVPPKLITVQGKVTDAAGAPLPAGIKAFAFRILSASSGGTQIWPSVGTEGQNLTTNAEGLWSGALGAVNPLTDVVFADSVCWLEVTVNGQVLPRVRLVTGPYAMRVATVDGATGGQIAGMVSVSGVAEGLRLEGPGLGAANEAYMRFTDQAGVSTGYVGDAHPGNQDIYLLSNTGNVHLWTAAGEVLTASATTGNVGIGTSSPGSRLEVQSEFAGVAIRGRTGSDGIGISGFIEDGGSGYAGYFNGRVNVSGTLTKSAGSFKIDHPLDPANKYLSHSFVESPDMMNIYNGNVTLDANGEAVIDLPGWFGALNKDFRYQLTAIGAPGPNLYIAQKVSNDRFRIGGGAPGMEVSWQVTGIRQDAYANAHRIPVEELKPSAERGFFRNPELFSQPEEKGIEWARNPEMMKQMKDEREKANADSK